MSLVVRHTNPLLNDSLDRNAIVRYCISKNYAYQFGDKFDAIDMFIAKSNGIRTALELTLDTCWTTQLKYPKSIIHIPRYKWKAFYEQAWDIPSKNFNRAEKAYFVILNTEYTRAAFISFSSILTDLALFTEYVKNTFNDSTIFVNVPASYILGYINLPPE